MNVAQKLAVNYYRAKLNIIATISKKRAARKAFEMFCTPYKKNKKKTPPIFAKAEKLEFDVDGYSIKGFRFNHPADKKILIIHGFESSIKNFDRYIGPFISKGYEVIGFDAPAHGKSDGKTITLPMYIQVLESIDQRYGPIDRFMAHSFGGLALTHLLEKFPSDRIVKSVLIAPATETTTAIDSFFRFLDLKDDIRVEFDKYIYKKSGVEPSYFSIRRAMKSIESPILWIHDEEDEVTPLSDVLKVKEDGYTNIEFEITKGLGHRRIYKENKTVKRIVDFL